MLMYNDASKVHGKIRVKTKFILVPKSLKSMQRVGSKNFMKMYIIKKSYAGFDVA